MAISLKPGTALDEFTAAQPVHAGMDYDADGDRFLFCHGGERGKVYVITPNATNEWDLSVLATSGMPSPTPASGAGINKRFRALPTLGGFVLLPSASSNLFFLPTR